MEHGDYREEPSKHSVLQPGNGFVGSFAYRPFQERTLHLKKPPDIGARVYTVQLKVFADGRMV